MTNERRLIDEVVRCKNCYHVHGFGGIKIEPDEVGICKMTQMCVAPDDFCSRCKKRVSDE